MPVNITMPALSPTMEEGNLAKWLVKEGDQVSPGDVIAEIETDKATMEVEAVEEGTLARIVVAEGSEGVKVNAVIAVLAEDGEDASAIDVPTSGGTDLDTTAPAPQPEDLEPETAEQRSVDEAHAHGKPEVSGSSGNATADDRTANGHDAPAERDGTSAHARGAGRIFASPLARRMAWQNEIDLSGLEGSGPHGRIVKSDIEAALEAGRASKDEAAPSTPKEPGREPREPAPVNMPDGDVVKLFEDGSFERLPHDGMRRTIAKRLTQSAQTVPAYVITVECRIDRLMALRTDVNAAAPERDGKPAYKVSVNDFVVKALGKALMAVPMANASWTSTDRLLHKHADVGVAVAVEGGLFTPIVRRVEEKTLSAISNEIKDLAARARSGKLKPTEYQGGVTAVSNLGMFGVKEFTSIINPPHASIVSIGAGEKRPVVEADALAIGTVMSATFAFDHRVIDGVLGAELAAAFKQALEQPMSMLV